MALSNEALERELANDLQTLGDLIHDESFYPELYKSLAGVPWARDDSHIALSWKKTEELLNEVRAGTTSRSCGSRRPAARARSPRGSRTRSSRSAGRRRASTPRHDDAHIDS